MMKRINRLGWFTILFFTIVLFVLNLSLQILSLNIIIIAISIVIYKNGSPIMFSEYEEKRKKKIEDSKVIREAANEVLKAGNLFKK